MSVIHCTCIVTIRILEIQFLDKPKEKKERTHSKRTTHVVATTSKVAIRRESFPRLSLFLFQLSAVIRSHQGRSRSLLPPHLLVPPLRSASPCSNSNTRSGGGSSHLRDATYSLCGNVGARHAPG